MYNIDNINYKGDTNNNVSSLINENNNNIVNNDGETELVRKVFEITLNKEKNQQNVVVNSDNGSQIAPFLCEVMVTSGIFLPEDKPFQCHLCVKRFPRAQLLKQHQMSHSDLKPWSCHICSRSFKKAAHRDSHILTHSRHTSPYVCKTCGKKFTQKAGLIAHERTHTGLRPYSCHMCQKTFDKLFSLKRHLLIHDRNYQDNKDRILEKISEEECVFAELSTNLSELKKVFKQELVDSENNNNVEQNKNEEKEVENILEENEKDAVQDTSTDKAYACGKCGKRFSRPTYVKQHQMSHSNLKPWSCDICTRSFKKAAHRDTHILTHSRHTSPHVCVTCGKQFTQKAGLIAHERTHTGLRPYSCHTCHKTFAKLYSLQRHERTHLVRSSVRKDTRVRAYGETAYKCVLCAKQFSQLTHLRRHKLTHDIKGEQMVVVKVSDSENKLKTEEQT